MIAEQTRLAEAREQNNPWKKWDPYLSERQWGPVRRGYSQGGDAWKLLCLFEVAGEIANRLTRICPRDERGGLDSQRVLEVGKMAGFARGGPK